LIKEFRYTHTRKIGLIGFQDKLHIEDQTLRWFCVFTLHLLNSWNQPGAILQAEEPEEIVEGGPEDWGKLREVLARRRKTGARFGSSAERGGWLYYLRGRVPIRLVSEDRVAGGNGFSAMWNERCANLDADVSAASCGLRHPDNKLSGLPATTDGRRTRRGKRSRRAWHGRRNTSRRAIFTRSNLAQNSTPVSPEIRTACSSICSRAVRRRAGRFSTSATRVSSRRRRNFSCASEAGTSRRARSRGRVRAAAILCATSSFAFELLTDPKELAELVMITDLERNDLGQICEYGSVTVTQLVQLERFAQVFHLVSTIEGMLRPGVDALDAVRACIPGGSISGRAETPRVRDHPGIGTLSARTLYGTHRLFRRQRRCGVQHCHPDDGAGGREPPLLGRQRITAGSVPAREYEETLHKAAGMEMAYEELRTQNLELRIDPSSKF